jgi:hypothetical protein
MKRRSLATNGLLATWLPCIALAAGSVLAALAMALQPPASGPIAVVFPGTPVRFGATGFVVVVMPDTPDAAGRLRHAGAWAVLDPLALGGCVAT